jgi:tRNA U34 5-methylaminomethyl-2-thiouridine-forming methyltransferase MnmC
MANHLQTPSVETTKDGSPTLHSPHFDQHYHNPHGALSESRHVFWEMARLPERLSRMEQPQSIFEIGLGSGLNFFMLLNEIRAYRAAGYFVASSLNYTAVEAYPISLETALELKFENVFEHITTKDVEHLFESLEPGMNAITFPDEVDVHIWANLFDSFVPPDTILPFTNIWQDAFSPDTNPDLWTDQVFTALANWSNQTTILTTYCAAVKARAAMAVGGWKLARAEGALFKREMTVAAIEPNLLADFKRVNEERLIMRWNRGDFAE